MTGKNDGLPALGWGSVLDDPARQTGEASKELSAKVASGPRQPTPGGLLATPRTHCCSCPVWLGHQQPLMDFRVLGLLQGTYLATSSSLKHQCLPICGAPTGLVRSYCTDPSVRLFRWLLLLPPRYWTSQGLVLGNNSFISSHFHSGIL